MSRLKAEDREYSGFAYVAAAIQKDEIVTALDRYSIDYEALSEMAKGWSYSEKAMLEVACQIFNGGNFFADEEGEWLFPSIGSVFKSLDSFNSKIVIEAITKRYMY